MSDILSLQQEIEKLKERNKRVETNKAWETSLSRKIIIILVTYILMGITFMSLGNPDPWINAIIPTLGFFLSTLTLPFLKNLWQKYLYHG
ncbi:MAG: hypothetical protein AAB553_03945 [Patescibacteria group bacterium]